MGFFVTLDGQFDCVSCRHFGEHSIQTKLLRSEASNSCQGYRVSDTELLDGLGPHSEIPKTRLA